MRRVPLVAGAVLALGALALPAASPAGSASMTVELGALQPTASFKDGTLRVARPLTTLRRDSWGGPTVAADGETVNVKFSDAYPVDAARQQQVADFIAQLYHGQELSLASFYIAPLSEVQSICGIETGGCYGQGQIVATGDTLPDGTSAANVLVHEYGHHVAANRLNPPWDAIDWGPKRWATSSRICVRQKAGTAFPGNESTHYDLNPGEAWAETYRLLNYRKQAWPAWVLTDWKIVDQSFYPGAAQLGAAKEDVLQPWTATKSRTVSGRLRNAAPRGKPARWRVSFPVPTPLDGDVTVVLGHAPLGTTMSFRTASGKVVAPGAHDVLTTTVCGRRNLVLTVRAPRRGLFSAAVSTS